MSTRRSFGTFSRMAALGLGLGLAFAAGAAHGADSKLDDAQAAVTKAIALLKEAQGNGPSFEEHRKKAVDLLTTVVPSSSVSSPVTAFSEFLPVFLNVMFRAMAPRTP